MSENKPIIETIINTAAIALTAAGTGMVIKTQWYGFLLILFGVGLEWFKYMGRIKKWW